MPKPPPQLDSRIEIVTPENIAYQYRLAGPFRRAPAYLIDCLVQAGIYFVVFMVLGVTGHAAGLGGMGLGVAMVIVFFVSWFYGGVLETFWNGQTIGKWTAGIRVVSTDGRPIDALQAVLRNLLRFVDALPPASASGVFGFPTYQIGLWAPACNNRYQRLGDLAAGTMVVFEERPRVHGVVRINEPEALRLAEWIPLDFVVSRSLARTLSMYVERRLTFAWARRIEIARHLATPLAAIFQLPRQTNPDMLLCALYHRTFFAIRPGEERERGGRAPAPPAPPTFQREADLSNYLDQIA